MVSLTRQSHSLNSYLFTPQTLRKSWPGVPAVVVALSVYDTQVTPIMPRLMQTKNPNDTGSEPIAKALGKVPSKAVAYKILVVEDESIVALDLSNTLRRLGYFVTGVAASGEQAVQQAVEMQPDLVMMDIRLQGNMDGIEAARQIRTQLHVPVIFLTAYVDENTLKRAQLTQPAGFLCKPFVKFELQETIAAALNRPVDD